MTINLSTLRSSLARDVAVFLVSAADHPHATLKGIQTLDSYDVLQVEIEPELSQKRVVRILDREPLDIIFPLEDREPRFRTRRADFPSDNVHTTRDNLLKETTLCLWEEGWSNVKRQLTAQSLIERVRAWFAKIAEGTIHQAGQALEPLINEASHTLIFPPGQRTGTLAVEHVESRGDLMFIKLANNPEKKKSHADFDVLECVVPTPILHGSVQSTPWTLSALVERLESWGLSILPPLEAWLRGANVNPNALPIILVSIPKTSVADGEAETWEYWAFTSTGRKAQFAEEMGLVYSQGGIVHMRIPRTAPDLDAVAVFPLRVVRRLEPADARKHSGLPDVGLNLVGVGAGALGSHVIVNSGHTGLGQWTVIDDDIVLPHNTVRLRQGDFYVGTPKALATANDVNLAIHRSMARAITADILRTTEHDANIVAALSAADLVCDFSASPAALGWISDNAETRRATSMFFNPGGDELVILAEDTRRETRLDEIEAQYFQAISARDCLQDHLSGGRVGFVRYANACQDLSRALPPWQVQTLSAIGTGRLATITASENADAKVWQLDHATGAISVLDIPISGVYRLRGQDMRMTLSKATAGKIRRLREGALPNETGGILLGTFDIAREVVHIVDVLPAPPDSVQKPSYFERGKADLAPAVTMIADRTFGNVQYIGEWHSHPRGATTDPSSDDANVLAHLGHHIGPTGAPFGMLICGDADMRLFFGWKTASLEARVELDG